mmetsp:Transcript_16193/g.27134  ORF Transcript_16193/g.27134 Transcript_16193/m.27134 type:complete len:165 (+) Transcript_16193:785-1279(+)|eukprot:CAMPEP_0114435098 /NCGR_PEP_ID=MMETSP0103-20121206/12635_1 /TAXON_ID=37642 ORGANISM="Paraphysomonas imperforata, Strain PA2" /NCGR_SAMPLE_ID=MMETSP0103 /ASSEMBLY_ACC=CAM_ASM_000201 /LENGTH=164 /DNA_ID=CAMNT_0001605073 /DNA_START=234 /DNA_END=728 /DNA_ORIENTATION=+
MPAEMKIDYIRLYQDPNDSSHTTSCSPPEFPTEQFIRDHKERFEIWSPKTPPLPASEAPFFTPGNTSQPLRGSGAPHSEFTHPIMLGTGLVICVGVAILWVFKTYGLSDQLMWILPLEPRKGGEVSSDQDAPSSRISERIPLMKRNTDPCDISPGEGAGTYGLT